MNNNAATNNEAKNLNFLPFSNLVFTSPSPKILKQDFELFCFVALTYIIITAKPRQLSCWVCSQVFQTQRRRGEKMNF